MSLETRFTLRRLVMFSLGSSFVPVLDLLAFLLFEQFGHLPRPFPYLLLTIVLTVLLPFAVAVGGALRGMKAVRRGLMDERWPAAEVEQALRLLQSPTVKWTAHGLIWSGLVLCGSFLLFQHANSGHGGFWGGLIYFFLPFSMTRTELLKLLAPSKVFSGTTAFLADLKPIVSAHWGERASQSGI